MSKPLIEDEYMQFSKFTLGEGSQLMMTKKQRRLA